MIVLTIGHNQKKEIQKCVESIRKFCDLDNVMIVVIDNCSIDGTAEWLKKEGDLAFATTETVEGSAQILNEAIQLFQFADDLLIIHPDCVITPGFLSSMYETLYQEEQIGIVEPIRDILDNSLFEISNKIVLIKNVLLDKVGAFNEESNDWQIAIEDYKRRAIQSGFQIQQALSAYAYDTWRAKDITEEGEMVVKVPVARLGETPFCSYEELYTNFYRNGFGINDVKAVHFICGKELVIGYELSLIKKCKNRLLILSSKMIITEYLVREIGKAYEWLGWEVIYRNTEDFYSGEINRIVERGIDRVFSINNGGWITNKEKGEKSWWDQLGITSLNYILDHPMYYDDTLSKSPELGVLLCVDRNHVKYAERFYAKIKNAFFLPLGGDNQLDGCGTCWSDRTIEVLYVGGYKGNLDIARLPSGAEAVLKKLQENVAWTTEYAIEHEMRMKNENLTDLNLKEEILRCKEVDWYLMTYIRVEVIRVLIEGGVNVTVYGGGWEKFEYFNSPNFIYKGCITQEECLEQMKSSKIVLNVMPWFKEGTHDRVINAMLAGAVCLSDGSNYMDEVFEKNKDYVCYDLNHLEQLPEMVKTVLQSDNDTMRMQAYHKAREQHRWLQRIEALENELEKIKSPL